jgi:hypothetical protein
MSVATEENATSRAKYASASMAKTYWRMSLYGNLLKPSLLTAVEIAGESRQFTTKTWEEYWADVPNVIQSKVCNLRKAWHDYIASGFDPSCAPAYCKAYLDLLHNAINREITGPCSSPTFLSKILAFENFVLTYRNTSTPFAAATASFRNPATVFVFINS